MEVRPVVIWFRFMTVRVTEVQNIKLTIIYHWYFIGPKIWTVKLTSRYLNPECSEPAVVLRL